MITAETIDRVREAADMVQIVGEHVKLRRMGRHYRGPCPLHGGKNPNFSVSPDKGYYRCFTCGEKGDVFTFLQKVVGCDFVTAVRTVAERSGIEIREDDGPRTEQRDAREPFWEMNAAAAAYFTTQLWESADAAAARAYLEKRSIGRVVADRFSLGYAPRANATKDHLLALGYDEARLLEVGLLARREESGETYSKFRDRLMIPIMDARGHPVGFGGRLLEDREGAAKYLNSPESPVFAKRRLLYNLHTARNAIRKEERAVVVEGYFDVIRLVDAGVESAVAGLGTALTEEHAAAIARLTKNVFLLYDSDEAGQRATFRAGRELLAQGAAVRVVSLPDGEDPDTFVAKQGGARLEQALTEAMDLFERQVRILQLKGWFADLSRTRKAIDRLLPTIRATTDALTRDIYLTRLGEAARVDKALLLREADERPARRDAEPSGGADNGGPPPDWQGGALPDEPDVPREARAPQFEARFSDRRKFRGRRQADEWQSDVSRPRVIADPSRAAERLLVQVMLHHPAMIESIASEISEEQFEDRRLADLFSALVERGASFDRVELSERVGPPASAVLDELLAAPEEVAQPVRLVAASVQRLQLRQLDAESAELQQRIRSTTDESVKNVITARLREINVERSRLGSRRFRTSSKRDPGR